MTTPGIIGHLRSAYQVSRGRLRILNLAGVAAPADVSIILVSSILDTGIHYRVCDISQEIHHDPHHYEQEHHRCQDREIVVAYCLDRKIAQARPRKYGFDHDRTRQKTCEQHGGHG